MSRFAWAQTYPSRPVRIIVGFAPAGATDIMARLIGQWLSERLGGKASDEQRVDNCKVPLDQRGSKPRPDDCRDGASKEVKH